MVSVELVWTGLVVLVVASVLVWTLRVVPVELVESAMVTVT